MTSEPEPSNMFVALTGALGPGGPPEPSIGEDVDLYALFVAYAELFGIETTVPATHPGAWETYEAEIAQTSGSARSGAWFQVGLRDTDVDRPLPTGAILEAAWQSFVCLTGAAVTGVRIHVPERFGAHSLRSVIGGADWVRSTPESAVVLVDLVCGSARPNLGEVLARTVAEADIGGVELATVPREDPSGSFPGLGEEEHLGHEGSRACASWRATVPGWTGLTTGWLVQYLTQALRDSDAAGPVTWTLRLEQPGETDQP